MERTDFVRDDEILALHEWRKRLNKRSGEPVRFVVKKLDPITVAAEAIICEKLLGRSRMDAIKAIQKAKIADDYRVLLPRNRRDDPAG